MNPKIWFVLSEGQVTGPFASDEVETQASAKADIQIWGRGQGEWISLSKWRQSQKELPAPTAQEELKLKQWKVRIGGQEKEAMSYFSLIDFLKTVHDYSNVEICLPPKNLWKDLYAVEQIVDDLGVSRRSHPRVPIVGALSRELENEQPVTYRVISISEGGLGINDAKNLQIGQTFKATLTSPNLYVSIDTTCEVVYIGNDGYAGLRFVGLPVEYKSSIVEYVNKFATG